VDDVPVGGLWPEKREVRRESTERYWQTGSMRGAKREAQGRPKLEEAVAAGSVEMPSIADLSMLFDVDSDAEAASDGAVPRTPGSAGGDRRAPHTPSTKRARSDGAAGARSARRLFSPRRPLAPVISTTVPTTRLGAPVTAAGASSEELVRRGPSAPAAEAAADRVEAVASLPSSLSEAAAALPKVAVRSRSVNDSDRHSFDQYRTTDLIKPGQFWAMYNEELVPAWYARIVMVERYTDNPQVLSPLDRTGSRPRTATLTRTAFYDAGNVLRRPIFWRPSSSWTWPRTATSCWTRSASSRTVRLPSPTASTRRQQPTPTGSPCTPSRVWVLATNALGEPCL